MIPWVQYALTLISDLIQTTALYIMILTTFLGSVIIKPTHRKDVITQSNDPRFKLNWEVYDAPIDSFCDGSIDFMSFVRLMSTFNEMYHAQNVQKLFQRLEVLSDRSLKNRACNASNKIDPKNLILIWDTGASFGIPPFKSDFIDYVESEIAVKDVTKVNKVIGIGTPLHKFEMTKGRVYSYGVYHIVCLLHL